METKNEEVEIKLEIDSNIYSEIKKKFLFKKSVFQENWFFDTRERLLLSHLWALRIRFESSESGQRIYITAKGPRKTKNQVHIRPEFEVEITPVDGERLISGFNLKQENFLPLVKLSEKFGDLMVYPLLNFSNQRSVFSWEKWFFELDETKIGDRTFYELEIEIEINEREWVIKKINELFSMYGWKIIYSTMNKFTKAINLLL